MFLRNIVSFSKGDHYFQNFTAGMASQLVHNEGFWDPMIIAIAITIKIIVILLLIIAII